MSDQKFILGSRSPRRLELLQRIVPASRIKVVPPRAVDEAGFENVHDWPSIEARLIAIARQKCDDVLQQIVSPSFPIVETVATVIAADTVIVVTAAGKLLVLGQPPENDSWKGTVRHWFRDYFAEQRHVAATGLCVATPLGQRIDRLITSEVTFHTDIDHLIDWYIQTEEPRGKAGGYALQGAADVFVSRVEGSLSNVIGLPLRELLDVFRELGIDVG